MGVYQNGGSPNSWMVYFMEHPTKMDDDWGYPYFRKPPYVFRGKSSINGPFSIAMLDSGSGNGRVVEPQMMSGK